MGLKASFQAVAIAATMVFLMANCVASLNGFRSQKIDLLNASKGTPWGKVMIT